MKSQGFAALLKKAAISARNENIEAFKSRRVVEDGNSFPAPSQYGEFVPIPVVFRAFLFHILTPPQVRAYLHLCCYAFGYYVRSVTGDRITLDTGLATPKAIYGPAVRLEKLGLILKKKQGFERNNPKSVNFYQRPSLEYTLIRLLEENVISSELVPLFNGKPGPKLFLLEHHKMHGKHIEATMRLILRDKYDDVYNEKREDRRKTSLLSVLHDRLQERIEDNKLMSAERSKKSRASSPRI